MEEIRDEAHLQKLIGIFAANAGREKIMELMLSGRKIRALGFWKGKDLSSSGFPVPQNFVDTDWDTIEKNNVIRYLKGASVRAVYMGLSWCRFNCGEIGMGAHEYTDGYYCWPEGLAHYLEKHHVRLPGEFVRHALNNLDKEFPETADQDTILLSVFAPDFEWWKSQQGFRFS